MRCLVPGYPILKRDTRLLGQEGLCVVGTSQVSGLGETGNRIKGFGQSFLWKSSIRHYAMPLCFSGYYLLTRVPSGSLNVAVVSPAKRVLARTAHCGNPRGSNNSITGIVGIVVRGRWWLVALGLMTVAPGVWPCQGPGRCPHSGGVLKAAADRA
ncbi:hypothetical protein AAFF_G00191440 [Aldrovandia affinis]|uniref:Uncharacterized protein n=1 Tax=Aldrovandia affinis TaxID=143900 RepID=A0AAD7RJX9_9TELE|nr:hypothetical protein AAFF_G00191440 [Aldrovandia affinis]